MRSASAWRVLWCSLAVLVAVGCANVTPESREAEVASWDGNAQDSGIKDFRPDGVAISDGALAIYSSLVKRYGADLTPPVAVGYGVSALAPGRWLLTYEALSIWYRLIDVAEQEKVRKSGTLLNKVL